MTPPTQPFPTYAELQARADAPAGSAWGLWGADDELGTLNHLTPERVRAAAGLVRTGEVVNLDLALEAFTPTLVPSRQPLQHHLFANNPFHRDDYVDRFYTQSSSQLDGLRHIGHPEAGFYNGGDPSGFTAGSPRLGINRFAERGIVGRGVLVDVDRHLRDQGRPIDHAGGQAIPVSDVQDAADAQQVQLRDGDILMIHTGWTRYHLHEIDDQQRQASTARIRASGLRADNDTVAWLWDHRFAIVATDNFAVEAWPARDDSPFVTDSERAGLISRSSHTGLMHRVLIPLLGVVLGELWDLDRLAELCAADGRWDCMIVVSPLFLTGGAGSPANATAIR